MCKCMCVCVCLCGGGGGSVGIVSLQTLELAQPVLRGVTAAGIWKTPGTGE